MEHKKAEGGSPQPHTITKTGSCLFMPMATLAHFQTLPNRSYVISSRPIRFLKWATLAMGMNRVPPARGSHACLRLPCTLKLTPETSIPFLYMYLMLLHVQMLVRVPGQCISG